MKNINIKVYHLFLGIALIVLLIGILGKDKTLDVNIHDTYFVASYRDVSIILFFLFFLNGIGYLLLIKTFKKQLIRILTVIHSVIIIGSFIIYWAVVVYYKYFAVKDPFSLFDDQVSENIILTCSAILIVFIAQPLFIINLLVGLFRKNNA
jgi:hypothetical protein